MAWRHYANRLTHLAIEINTNYVYKMIEGQAAMPVLLFFDNYSPLLTVSLQLTLTS